VIWRVASRAIRLSARGPLEAVVDSVELRDGERFARLNIAGVQLDVAVEETSLHEREVCRFFIDPGGVSAWTVGAGARHEAFHNAAQCFP
jgi:molybdate transport system permease protein